MHGLILWAGFLGAWFLVAGPVYQAVLELGEEEFERERLNEVAEGLPPPPPISSWWWLLPPARLWLGHRRSEEWKDAIILELPDEEFEALSSFMSKARGWILVGTGGLLIAAKETYELVEGNEWEVWTFWVLMTLMAMVALGNAAYQSAREGRVREHRAARSAG